MSMSATPFPFKQIAARNKVVGRHRFAQHALHERFCCSVKALRCLLHLHNIIAFRCFLQGMLPAQTVAHHIPDRRCWLVRKAQLSNGFRKAEFQIWPRAVLTKMQT